MSNPTQQQLGCDNDDREQNDSSELRVWRGIEKKRRRDTTQDDPQWITDPFGIVDVYSLAVFFLAGGIKIAVLLIPLFVLLALPVALNALFLRALAGRRSEPAERRIQISRIHALTVAACAVPAILVVVVNLVIDVLLIHVFGILYALLGWRWTTVRRNLDVLRPFRSGPPIWRCMPQIISASSGMFLRQGFWEFTFSFTNMFLLNPWIKYWFSANLWMHTLDVRFVTQIGESLENVPIDQIFENFQTTISWGVLSGADTAAVDDDLFFVPHYPFPAAAAKSKSKSKSKSAAPPRHWAVGMQHASYVTTLVHTTHAPHFDVLSESCERPVYRVVLWRNNPFHIYTGYVEANISTVKRGAEHPMWIVSGHNDIAANRSRLFASGWIDRYFHDFMPAFQSFLQRGRRRSSPARLGKV